MSFKPLPVRHILACAPNRSLVTERKVSLSAETNQNWSAALFPDRGQIYSGLALKGTYKSVNRSIVALHFM
jgi:hypothetical protein